MTRRTKIWLVVGVLFVLANLAGAGMAAAGREWAHMGLHTGLLLLGEYFVWRLLTRRAARY
jgi:hypothetical protein